MQKIRIKLKSYDHNLIDKSSEKIVRTLKADRSTGRRTSATANKAFNLYRKQVAALVDKKSREQFELLTHKRLIDISIHLRKQ